MSKRRLDTSKSRANKITMLLSKRTQSVLLLSSRQCAECIDSLPLILGENGVAFAKGFVAKSDGSSSDVDQIPAFDLNSGSPYWKYQSGAQSTLSILAVLSDGSL